MTRRSKDRLAAWTGAIVGLAFAGWLLVAAPMLYNIQEHGCPFIVCEQRLAPSQSR